MDKGAFDFTDPSTWELDLGRLNIAELIEFGVKVRDELRERSRDFKKFEKEAKEFQLKVGMALKEMGDSLGVNAFNTSEGTAYRNRKESYRVGDWQQVLAFIKETGNWQMLEKRVGKLATKEIHESTIEKHEINGEMVDVKVVPPGVLYHVEEVFVLRRPNEKGGDED